MEHPFFDACGFTPPFPEVIEFCPADPADLDRQGPQGKTLLPQGKAG